MFMSRYLCTVDISPQVINKGTIGLAAPSADLDLSANILKTHNEEFEWFKFLDGYKIDRSVLSEPVTIVHSPVHDAESVYWIMVFFLIRAHPKGDPIDTKPNRFRNDFFSSLVTTQIDDDHRDHIIRAAKGRWGQALSPKLAPLASMMDSWYLFQRAVAPHASTTRTPVPRS